MDMYSSSQDSVSYVQATSPQPSGFPPLTVSMDIDTRSYTHSRSPRLHRASPPRAHRGRRQGLQGTPKRQVGDVPVIRLGGTVLPPEVEKVLSRGPKYSVEAPSTNSWQLPIALRTKCMLKKGSVVVKNV
ncbi:hypothetical protein HPB52_005300 [Rhipicephalus sanguineus]|uniref:Uncharacterized protein n=1 Tax=Rhipicephalus sanguineus TaxID=34632 RepID=A0A9D4PVM5_RHISA|nr:hypothetical protein HPB52_005300 [Rhipicephalus sanguineus]